MSGGDENGAAVEDAVRERIADDPFCDTLGIELVGLDQGRAVTELRVTGALANFHGTAHGGAVYALADAAFAAASNARGETALALETSVSYLEAVDVGATLRATATETHRAVRTAEYQVRVARAGSDDRVATFRGRVYRPGDG